MCRSKFVQIKIMNLNYLGFTNEARKLVGFDRCLHYFEINKTVYWELTLEMLNTFDMDNNVVRHHYPRGIWFQVHGEHKSIRFSTFATFLGMYDKDLTLSLEYQILSLDFLTRVSPYATCDMISRRIVILQEGILDLAAGTSLQSCII